MPPHAVQPRTCLVHTLAIVLLSMIPQVGRTAATITSVNTRNTRDRVQVAQVSITKATIPLTLVCKTRPCHFTCDKSVNRSTVIFSSSPCKSHCRMSSSIDKGCVAAQQAANNCKERVRVGISRTRLALFECSATGAFSKNNKHVPICQSYASPRLQNTNDKLQVKPLPCHAIVNGDTCSTTQSARLGGVIMEQR